MFSTDRQEVSLTDLRAKNVLLLFFPLAFSSVCTTELCAMRDNISTYAGLNAEIVAVSVDSPYTLAKFRELERLPFTLLSDFNKAVSLAYGAYYETFSMKLKGVSKRAAFVIDRNDVIQYAEVLDNPGEVPNFEAIQAVLQSIT